MSSFLWQNTQQQFFDSNGVPLNGGKVFFYAAGSTTKQNTYTDSTGTVPNANPMILDAAGRLAQAVWMTGGLTYKVGLTLSTEPDPPSTFVTPWPLDNIKGIGDTTTTVTEWIASGLTPTYVSASSFTLVGDQTTLFPKGRRLQIIDSGGTKYATVVSSAFGALTAVTVAGDNGTTLATPTSSVAYGIVNAASPSIGADEVDRKANAVASAATTDIWSGGGNLIHITGAVGITSLGTAPYAGVERSVIIDSTPTITHNATTLQLPGGANIVAQAGDRMTVRADTTANMIVTSYTRAAYAPSVGKLPTRQVFTSGTGTYTTPTGATRLVVRMVGGGGGGGGAPATAGTAGNNTTFSTFTASGGAAGTGALAGGAGGAAAGGTINIPGGAGGGGGKTSVANVFMPGGMGGSSAFGGAGASGLGNAVGGAGATNSGGGGGGGGGGSAQDSASGGGSGGYVEGYITSPAATYSYSVAGTAAGGVGATTTGGAGAAGIIIVEEIYT